MTETGKTKSHASSEELAKLKERAAELEENWKRAVADGRNLERRTRMEREAVSQFGNALLLAKLLPVVDALEEAAAIINDSGVLLILKQLREVLNSEGVKEIEAEGQKFDPNLHEAVEVTAGEKDQVIEVVAKGYIMGDRVIRPAKVKVGNSKL